jgi:PAS domain S-box-containing protein
VRIVTRLTLVSLVSTLAMTLAVLLASLFVIDRMAHRSHERLMQLELVNAMQAIQQRLYADGVRAATREAEGQYRLLRAKEGFGTLSLFVVDRTDQRIVYHPDARPGTQVRLPFVLDMVGRKAGTLAYDYRDGRRLAVFQTLEPVNWLVGLGVSVSEIRAVLPAFLKTIGGIESAALALNALVLGSFGLWMMRRIKATAQCVGRIEAGELGARIDPGRSVDEIAQLQLGVNAMGERIEQRTREQQAARAELSASRAILRAVLDNAPALVAVRDLDERFILVNRRYEQVLGVREADIVGRTLDDVFAPERAEQFRLGSAAVLRDEGPVRHEMTLMVDGEERWFLAQRYPLTGEDGRFAGVCGIASDITDLKRAESERQARREAEAASRAKSDFLSSVSHELRTPLNAILGYAQLLRMTPARSDEQAKKWLSTIEASGEHLLSLITDLLELARFEAGKADELEPAPVDLRALLHTVCDIVRVRAEEKGVKLRLDVPEGLPRRVLIDEQRMCQVLLNLLGNAVKFTDVGEVRLRVRTRPVGGDAPVEAWRFDVIDTGIGMSPQQIARLFRPFEQVGEARHRAGGSGLGLAISQGLVRLMGGTIEVESDPGRGSRFSFELDLARAEMAEFPDRQRGTR